jgi:hypothetical protein
MRRLHDAGEAEEDVESDGEDEIARRRIGALRAGRRAEDPRLADSSWMSMSERTHRVPRTRAGEAHMECVSNWLHDLSQMIEPSSP